MILFRILIFNQGFSLATFEQKMGFCKESFAFLKHCEHVFYSNAHEQPSWKVVLRNEVHGRKIQNSKNKENGVQQMFAMGHDFEYKGLAIHLIDDELPKIAIGQTFRIQDILRP
jgi:hypothetical protein